VVQDFFHQQYFRLKSANINRELGWNWNAGSAGTMLKPPLGDTATLQRFHGTALFRVAGPPEK